MKAWFVTFAEYTREANRTVYTILDGLSPDEREKERGSYYGSLSGLVLHLLGGTLFFHSLFKDALGEGSAAVTALDYPAVSLPKGKLSEAQWKSLGPVFESADGATVNFIGSLADKELSAPIKLNWYGGNPPSVPLSFMLQQLTVHGVHHRGQISQILDELKVDNDYSGINVAFLPR
ncbi:damage-inducible protein DinB [Treponema sp. TIM-1]|uniref:DinB family protein n=1 Tax=Treponema sp. TIM-1 TaxID=2898417 RepID=UPI00397EA62F